ncbi:hypothetical protein [Polaribacter sp.]|uniref:hypothetical protein n=1 Tax=Polaribacter sp. TaxID=1920175 RepID=UPI0025D43A1D|nr:hypothetical protein [Polaribacter sp.]
MNESAVTSTETKQKSIQLIEGTFTKGEALNIINDVLNVKINFHKIQRLSKTEGNINDECLYDNSRITELMTDKKIGKAFLRALESKGQNIKISSTINITLEE